MFKNMEEENNVEQSVETDWYEEWFNSPLYEQLYANRDEKEAERLAEFISKKLPPKTYNPALDLGCGRGRHSITLARRGYQVTGVDLSPRAVETARKRAEDEGLGTSVKFQIGDMRQPVGNTFNLIVNLFTTFGYFREDKENIAVLKNVKTMLRPDGCFVFDFLNASHVRSSIKPEEEGKLESYHYHITRNIVDDTVQKTITFQPPDGKECSFTERVKLYDKAWFEKHLNQMDFNIDDIFGGYEGQEFEEATSPRLLIFARM